jgi:hypothetical protein
MSLRLDGQICIASHRVDNDQPTCPLVRPRVRWVSTGLLESLYRVTGIGQGDVWIDRITQYREARGVEKHLLHTDVAAVVCRLGASAGSAISLGGLTGRPRY